MFDTGLTAFMLFATSLVMLMTPGLAFFYGGLACKKNILGVMIQSFASLGLSTILWVTFGYSLCFSGSLAEGNDFFGIYGNFDKIFLNNIEPNSVYSPQKRFPELVFVCYQMMFAIITPALITGAFVNRVTFKSYIFFLILWQFLVYYPFVHMVWGGGILQSLGVLDFAGGIVVHATAGFAALASIRYVGSRKVRDNVPSNIPLVAVGTALLWFGWYGFNAGSELDLDGVTISAFINTDVAASFAAITWLILEWNTGAKKPTFVGLMTGSVAGLATITPASGYVTIPVAMLIGVIAAAGCWFAVRFKHRKDWDDALDVWGVHGMGGVMGTILLGLFATKTINANGADGLFYNFIEGGKFLGIQILAVLFACVYAYYFTFYMLKLINKFVRVKVSGVQERKGLDITLHGESVRSY